MKFKIGVLQIRNMVITKIYIDSRTALITIWNKHTFQLNSGLHLNDNLKKEWAEFGQKNFNIAILSETK